MRPLHFRTDHKEATKTQPTSVQSSTQNYCRQKCTNWLKTQFLWACLLIYSYIHSLWVITEIFQHSSLPNTVRVVSLNQCCLHWYHLCFRVSNLVSNLTLLKCLIEYIQSNVELKLNISTGRTCLCGTNIYNILSTYVHKGGKFFRKEIKLSID